MKLPTKDYKGHFVNYLLIFAILVFGGFFAAVIAMFFDWVSAIGVLAIEAIIVLLLLSKAGFKRNQSGSARMMAVVILLIIIVAALIVVFVVSPAYSIPPKHSTIANSIKILDTSGNIQLIPVCMSSRTNKFGEGLATQTFERGQSYQQSTWHWLRAGDLEFAMSIWGPGDDKQTYLVEFGRVGGDAFKITSGGLPKFDIPAVSGDEWTTGKAEGYYHFDVVLP